MNIRYWLFGQRREDVLREIVVKSKYHHEVVKMGEGVQAGCVARLPMVSGKTGLYLVSAKSSADSSEKGKKDWLFTFQGYEEFIDEPRVRVV